MGMSIALGRWSFGYAMGFRDSLVLGIGMGDCRQGSGRIDQSQNMTVAAMQLADLNVRTQLS